MTRNLLFLTKLVHIYFLAITYMYTEILKSSSCEGNLLYFGINEV